MDQNYFPWDETKEDNTFPTGDFHMLWKELESGVSQTGKLMLKAVFACKQPPEYAGMQHYEYFVLGTDEQPMSVVPGSMGTRAFKKALMAAQVPPGNNLGQLVAGAVNSELVMSITEYTEKDGAYAGMPRNRISACHRLGEREPKVAAVVGAPRAPIVAPPPLVAQEATTPPVNPTAPVIPTTPAVPQTPPPPVQPATPPPAPPAAASAGQVMRCTICQSDVPIANFSAHVQAHMAQPAAAG